MSAKKTISSRPRRPGPAAAKTQRAPQSPPIVLAMVTEALQSWVIPVLSVAAAVVFWLLSAFGILSEETAVLDIAGSLLVLVLFLSFQHYFFADDRRQRYGSVALATAWAILLFANFYRHDFPGTPLASGVLHPDGQALPVSDDSRISIVVEGRFNASEGRGNRSGHYRIELVPDSGAPESVDGTFEDRFDQRRLGRRGSTTVEVQHTSERHVVDISGRTGIKLRLADIDKSLAPEVRVAVYPAPNPWLFPLLGVAGIVGALALEKWADGDGSALMAASVTFFVVDQYLRWAPPHPQLKALIGAILVGSFIGAPLAAILWRLVPRRWFARR